MKFTATMALAFLVAAGPLAAAHHEKPLPFKDMDTDGSKSVSLEEWVAGHRNPKGHASADTDGDGQVTREEMKAQTERWKANQANKTKQEG